MAEECFRQIGDSKQIQVTMANRAHVLVALGRTESAENLAVQLLSGGVELHPMAESEALFVVGEACRARGDHARSIEYYSRAVELLEGAFGRVHSEGRQLYASLGLALARVGGDVAMLRHLAASETMVALVGRGHFSLEFGKELEAISRTHHEAGDLDLELAVLEWAIRVKRVNLGHSEASRSLAVSLHNRSNALKRRGSDGDLMQAIEDCWAVIALEREVFGVMYPQESAETYSLLIRLNMQIENAAEVARLCAVAGKFYLSSAQVGGHVLLRSAAADGAQFLGRRRRSFRIRRGKVGRS